MKTSRIKSTIFPILVAGTQILMTGCSQSTSVLFVNETKFVVKVSNLDANQVSSEVKLMPGEGCRKFFVDFAEKFIVTKNGSSQMISPDLISNSDRMIEDNMYFFPIVDEKVLPKFKQSEP